MQIQMAKADLSKNLDTSWEFKKLRKEKKMRKVSSSSLHHNALCL